MWDGPVPLKVYTHLRTHMHSWTTIGQNGQADEPALSQDKDCMPIMHTVVNAASPIRVGTRVDATRSACTPVKNTPSTRTGVSARTRAHTTTPRTHADRLPAGYWNIAMATRDSGQLVNRAKCAYVHRLICKCSTAL